MWHIIQKQTLKGFAFALEPSVSHRIIKDATRILRRKDQSTHPQKNI